MRLTRYYMALAAARNATGPPPLPVYPADVVCAFDCSHPASLVTSGSQVTQWRDFSNYGRHTTLPAGNPAPTWQLERGVKVPFFTNVDSLLCDYQQRLSEASIFFLCRPDALQGYQSPVFDAALGAFVYFDNNQLKSHLGYNFGQLDELDIGSWLLASFRVSNSGGPEGKGNQRYVSQGDYQITGSLGADTDFQGLTQQ
ncbi:hypothetical protein FNT36_18535 [Hymenobacter setariae]|uniref:Uncharacterized protein n=1 Tax=Hymenobacter setariae TaxID=2594794 RepID=A0A558BT28_9BACT|nr:hypothetical protein [Hymenobacter setariae]TVT39639.1 hypothetical protein FNT36_18535 [Hymenobacter setariae]